MTKVAVTRITHETGGNGLETELNLLGDRIRERAYGIYQERGSTDGGALDHWLEAESELTVLGESDLAETDSSFELSMITDGLDTNSLVISASSGSIAICGRSGDGNKVLCECFDVPGTIDVDHVTANVENEILRVTAKKAGATEKQTASRDTVARDKTPAAKAAAA